MSTQVFFEAPPKRWAPVVLDDLPRVGDSVHIDGDGYVVRNVVWFHKTSVGETNPRLESVRVVLRAPEAPE